MFKYAYEKQKAQGSLIILGWAGGQKEGLRTDRWEETDAVLNLLSPAQRGQWKEAHGFLCSPEGMFPYNMRKELTQ